MNREIQSLIFKAIDESLTDVEFDLLQNELEQHADVRKQYLRAVHLCQSLGEVATDEFSVPDVKTDLISAQVSLPTSTPAHAPSTKETSSILAFSDDWFSAVSNAGRRRVGLGVVLGWATLLLGLIGGAAFLLGREFAPTSKSQVAATPAAVPTEMTESRERTIAGHASLRRAVDLQWRESQKVYREGDVLPAGLLRIAGGIAEIDFFCGATLIVEGPASLNVESDWSVRLLQGRLWANVPPAARGFVVRAADSEIVDLGTEFALEVGDDHAQVKVLDGEVKLVGGKHDGSHLWSGDQKTLTGAMAESPNFGEFSTKNDLQRRRLDGMKRRMQEWEKYSEMLRNDDRLIAYYPIAAGQIDRGVSNVAASGASFDGRLVGLVDRVAGRFGEASRGLGFDRTGSRVRVRIDGEFNAFSFACWVKIDRLDHRYNSLFMGDGYENGEPHWQIRDDGQLMFSVMVDDTQEVAIFNAFDEGVVKDAGLHKVYFSEPIWDVSKSGQWFHLAAVYDPANRRVTQYANGKQVGDAVITDPFFTDELRIGSAEIGNWGQPFRESPWFAVRNLNGIIDEMVIFGSPLRSDEIQMMFQQGKPLGY